MRLRVHLLILLVFSLFSASGHAADCAKGTRSSLQLSRVNVSFVPRHGQSLGKTSLVLRSEPGGEILLSKEYEGNWICIGFNKTNKTYIMGGILERGAWLPLCSIHKDLPSPHYSRGLARKLSNESIMRDGHRFFGSPSS